MTFDLNNLADIQLKTRSHAPMPLVGERIKDSQQAPNPSALPLETEVILIFE
jgi:hypothetical protein